MKKLILAVVCVGILTVGFGALNTGAKTAEQMPPTLISYSTTL